jgi:hypothetical protein
MKTICAAMLCLWTVTAVAAEPGDAQGVLLLRNGQTIEGHVTRGSDHYQVSFPGGEIADVELYCRTLNEGYQRKRAAIQAGNVQDHLELARWCERHEMYRFAADELSAAAAIEPDHPMLGVLRRRLELAKEPPPKPVAAAASPAPSPEDLDRMVRGMPPGTVETFTQTVQPLLMNHCMSSGCHGPQAESALRLMRTPVDQPPGRRLTQRNLHAIMQFVDYNDAKSSRLLSAISGPHATVKAAMFSDRQAGHYKQIADWVNQVTGHPGAADIPESVLFGDKQPVAAAAQAGTNPAQPRLLSPAAVHNGRPLPRPGREGKPGLVRAASALVDTVESDDSPAGESDSPSKPRRPHPTGSHTTVKRSPPAPDTSASADPFDPEIFNRRYAPPARDAADGEKARKTSE